jgi:hypothetical protein
MKHKLLFLFLLLSLKIYGQACTLSVSIAATSTTICSGNPVTLTANATAGTPGYSYVWSTGDTTQSITINKPATYSVIVKDKTTGCTAVTKSIVITGGTVPNSPTAANVITCPGTTAVITATGPGGTYQWYDAPTGGNFLGTGSSFTTPVITGRRFFYVETTMGGCTSLRTQVSADQIGSPFVAPVITCEGSSVTFNGHGATIYKWYDRPGGTLLYTGPSFTTPALFANTTYYAVGITNGCASAPTAAIATIIPAPTAPVSSNKNVCWGSVASLHATAAAGALFNWYSVPSGGVSLISSPDFTTPPLTSTTTYYVEVSLNGCISLRTPVVVTVNPIPVAPTAPTATTCSGNAAILTATAPGGTYEWFATPTSTTVLATGSSFTTPVLNSAAVYYVQATVSGCTSPRTAVNIIVNPSLAAPTAPGVSICSGNNATITAIGPGGNYEWYDTLTGGSLLGSGASYTTPVLTATTNYYVQTTIGGCTSTRTTVTVSVKPLPVAPTAPGRTVCIGSTAALTATGTGSGYQWYDAAAGGNLLATTQNYTTPTLSASKTYYVQNINNDGCSSSRTAVLVTVVAPPVNPVANSVAVCSGSPANLSASAATGTIQWYNAASRGTLLTTGNAYKTPNLTVTTTYYIQATNGICTSPRVPVTVNITTVSNQFQYTSGTFCNWGGTATPTINIPGGVFSASPSGLVIDPTTGNVNTAASLPGTYTVTYANTCGITTAMLTITTTSGAGFAYSSASFCQDDINPAPIYATGSSAGVFTAVPAGLVFINNTTGIINLAESAPGTYVVTNTINSNSVCTATGNAFTVTIYEKVKTNAGPDQTVGIGIPVRLAGAISGGVTTGRWTGGAGSFSNSNLLNAIYTPAPGETGNVTLTLTSANPGNACGPKADNIVITFNPIPAAPTAAGTTICAGSVATLVATAPGGSYKWFNAAVGGIQLTTTAHYISPPLSANTTYYVQATVNGVTGPRTAVPVTVTQLIAAPDATGASICSGNRTTLTASGSSGTYEWYTEATGGSFLGAGDTFTTAYLTASTSYYVQTTINGCSSPRKKVDVTVHPLASITSAVSSTICSGNQLNYNITANVTGTTFSWTRAGVSGISNAAASASSEVINETLVNTTIANINVTYVITPTANGCTGVPFNYVVTVYPISNLTSPLTALVCSGSSPNYDITFSVPGTFFSWSRTAVAGITNSAVSAQTSSRIQEILNNTTNAPINVTYEVTSYTANCPGATYSVVITVNPKVTITSPRNSTVCSASPLNYTVTSNVPTAVFSWSRAAVSGISNPASNNNVSGTIAETLINTTNNAITVNYVINIVSNGCQPTPFAYSVIVHPSPPMPVANSNSPVCVGSNVNLLTPTIVAGATYLWIGPNGFTSTQRNPAISNVTTANSGVYTLYLVSNGCTGLGATVNVSVNELPIANAGADQTICNSVAAITLTGDVHGGTTTGLWTTSGTGTFFPSANALNGQYIPSAQDRSNGTVKLTLASTSKDDCTIAIDDLILKIQPVQVKPVIQ